MITGHVFIATSLDGFIAREDGDIGWLLERDDPAEDHGYDRFIAGIDVIVMGRSTYEAIRNLNPWPCSRPVLVLSATLGPADLPPDHAGKLRISSKSPQAAMAMLAVEGYRRAYVDGGRVIQSFLMAGLIADMVITHVPILLGRGRSLFGASGPEIALIHEQSESFASGLVQSRYRVAA